MKKAKKRILFLIIIIIIFSYLIISYSSQKEIYKAIDQTEKIKVSKNDDSADYQTVAWLNVQGTNIDTKVLNFHDLKTLNNYSKDNFLWTNTEKNSNQTTIYGHNILNLSSNPKVNETYFKNFDDLMSFIYFDFIKENKYITYTTDNVNEIYKIFGVFLEKDYNLVIKETGNYSSQIMEKYLNQIQALSIYDFDVEVTSNDKILTLSTCTRFFGFDNKKQFLVVARKLHKNESLTNYKVKKNKNYKEIEEIMKGVGKANEENAL